MDVKTLERRVLHASGTVPRLAFYILADPECAAKLTTIAAVSVDREPFGHLDCPKALCLCDGDRVLAPWSGGVFKVGANAVAAAAAFKQGRLCIRRWDNRPMRRADPSDKAMLSSNARLESEDGGTVTVRVPFFVHVELELQGKLVRRVQASTPFFIKAFDNVMVSQDAWGMKAQPDGADQAFPSRLPPALCMPVQRMVVELDTRAEAGFYGGGEAVERLPVTIQVHYLQ